MCSPGLKLLAAVQVEQGKVMALLEVVVDAVRRCSSFLLPS